MKWLRCLLHRKVWVLDTVSLSGDYGIETYRKVCAHEVEA